MLQIDLASTGELINSECQVLRHSVCSSAFAGIKRLTTPLGATQKNDSESTAVLLKRTFITEHPDHSTEIAQAFLWRLQMAKHDSAYSNDKAFKLVDPKIVSTLTSKKAQVRVHCCLHIMAKRCVEGVCSDGPLLSSQ